MIEFVKEYWHFFVAALILLALIAYWIVEIVRSKKEKEKELDQMEAKLEELDQVEEKQKEKVEEKQPKAKLEKKQEEKAPEVEGKVGDYMVSYDEDKKDWVVKREGGKRATKRTKTKQEALDYVKQLTQNQEVDVIVKKKDGEVQK